MRHEQPQLGGLFILIGLSIEHVVQSKKIQVDLAAQVAQQAKAAAAATSQVVAAPVSASGMGAVGA